LQKIDRELATIMKQQAAAVVAPTTRAPKARPRRGARTSVELPRRWRRVRGGTGPQRSKNSR
jgi:hypothetical protein